MSRSRKVGAFLTDDSAVSVIEYALIAALIAVFIIGSLHNVSSEIITLYQHIAGTVDEAIK